MAYRIDEISKEELTLIVDKSRSKTEVLEQLNYRNPATPLFAKLHDRFRSDNISVDHFCHTRCVEPGLSFAEYIQKHERARSQVIKRKLLKEELLPYRCALCKIGPKWNGKELVLQLDHIDGNHHHNDLPNLRFVCPNCHTQTPTFGRRNNRKRKPNRCSECETIISRRSKWCQKCAAGALKHKRRKVTWPTKEELTTLIKTHTFVALGKQFQVSDNTVRKWCISYGLPTKRAEITKL